MVREAATDLLSDDFWREAFRPSDPFRTDYAKEFRRGIVEARENDLAWARLAIYALQDAALLSVVARLIALAVEMPGAEFVESLAFFLSDEQSLVRLRPLLAARTIDMRQTMANDITALQDELTKRGDSDLAQRFVRVSDLVRVANTEKGGSR